MNRRCLNRREALLALALPVVSACATPVHQPLRAATPLPTPTPRPIRLPADDAPHDDLTEWWYYTGHLSGSRGQRYGFEFVIFQVKRQDIPVYYPSHFAITDWQRRAFHYDQRAWSREESPKEFNLTDGDWLIGGDGRSDRLRAGLAGYRIDLETTSTKPPVHHGTNGVVSFGPVGDSYYYSDTRLAVSGTLIDHGVSLPVRGEAWKDRQWGNFLTVSGAGSGWDWFSLQLDDGSELMLFLLRGAFGEVSPSYGTVISPDGQSRTLAPNEARVQPTSHWTSPHTHATYPQSWTITLPGRGLVLSVRPVIPDQELDTTQTTGQIYWEGEVEVTGTSDGMMVSGQGYVELTGYAQPTGGVSLPAPFGGGTR